MPIVAKTHKKPAAHVKKRNGQHHRHSKEYRKTYWPYLPMIAVFAVGLLINALWSNTGHVLGASSNFSASSLLAYTNADRSANQEGPLSLNSELMKAAQAKADNMAQLNYWSHDTPDGKTPWTFITGAGYDYQSAGENLAYGFSGASATITAWMNSPEHRANMLDSNFQDVGFGIASSPDFQGHGPAVIVDAMYAQPVQAVANITFTVPNHTTTDNEKNLSGTKLVSRLDLLPGGSSEWALLVVALVSGAAMATLLFRYGMRARRWFVKGERYVTHHPIFDAVVVAIIMIGVILTRTSGFIR